MKLIKLIICVMMFLTTKNAIGVECPQWNELQTLIKSQDDNKINEIKKILDEHPDCHDSARYILGNDATIEFAKKCFEKIDSLKQFIQKKYCITDMLDNITYGLVQKKYFKLLLNLGANINCKTAKMNDSNILVGSTETHFVNASILHFNLRDWWTTSFNDFLIENFNYSRERGTLHFLLKNGADVDLPADKIKLKNTDKNISHEYKNISAYELAKKLDLKEVVQMMEPYHRKPAVDSFAQALHSLSK